MAASDVKYEMKLLDGSGSYLSQIMDYTEEINADMIAIAYYNQDVIQVFNKFAQNILTNDLNKPALIINSKSVSSQHF
jgi:hypothetical protein